MRKARHTNVKGTDTRAQIHTLEGVSAALLLITAAFFATQSVAITPTSSSTASQETRQEIRQVSDDILTQAHSNGDLKEAILNWSTPTRKFNESGAGTYYKGKVPPDDFGEALNQTFSDRGISFNVELVYNKTSGSTETLTFVENGEPTNNAAAVTQLIVIHDDDKLGSGRRVDDSNYPVENREPGGLYNVVEVRMTVWRK